MTTEAHVIAGHKANLHNPNTSDEAKDHSKEILKENFNLVVDGNKTKDLDRVEAGLKGAMHNDNLSEEAQFAAAERLGELKK
ncbi:conidiation-specific protein 6 [Diaporthe amygdali]|uniref:conidiation-specific protein 6 n=1 Tax=Phomopsis amygdali TaxID=1214568 RepID=UPI0022FEEAC5|nr:conidiation-specific protein 6 [Diaporthe amygdali]KAJ0109582.1 conidiation-specific protein 6 [Diaporthe amygdali]